MTDFLKITGVVGVLTITLTGLIMGMYLKHDLDMSKLGFQKETIQGYSCLVWQKIDSLNEETTQEK